jgi:beta-glucosidase
MNDSQNESIVNSPFPKGFLWGSATASYQVEGGIENNDWAEGARNGILPICGTSMDHYNRFESDFDIAKSLGQNAHRLSIEWSRIEPEEGKFDEKEIEHYRQVLRALRVRGLEPFVTLWHFTLPIWFSDKGGFNQKNSPEIFARYSKYVLEKLGNEAKFWMTMNEPMVWSKAGYLTSAWPPFKMNPISYLSVVNRLVVSHNLAFKEIKKNFPLVLVGIAKHNIAFVSNGKWWNNICSGFMNWFWNERFLNGISKSQDFIGLNYYFYKKFGDKEKYQKSDMGWDIVPEGLYIVLKRLQKYKKPIYVTENGIADEADTKRADFIRASLRFVKKAIDKGVDIRGYFYWSLLDNFEWSYGFAKRFGLVEIDYKTLERSIRPSAYIYKEIAEKNIV